MSEEPQNGPLRDRRGMFLPGHGGRPKGVKNKTSRVVRETAALVAEMEHAVGEDGRKITKLQALMERLLDDGIDGNTQASIVFLAYHSGRPTQMKDPDGGGDDDEKLEQLAESYLRRRLAESGRSSWQPGSGAHDIKGNGESNGAMNNGATDDAE